MITRLVARDFRNLRAFAWHPQPGWNVLEGPNGAGKTSVLEALYAATTTRSFRAARLAGCVRRGADGFRVEVETEDEARARLTVSWGQTGLDRRNNGSSTELAEHLAVQPVVLWWLGSLAVVGGGPAERRRLLDQGLVALSPKTLAASGRYRRALKQKRRLLAEGRRANGAELESWNELLAAEASVLVRARADYVARLTAAVDEILEADGGDARAVELRYRPSLPQALDGVEAAQRALGSWRRREQDSGRTLVGPQRDELVIRWRGAVAETASGGERKWITLVLAAGRGRVLEAAGKSPVYLLDDLDAELDAERLRRSQRLFSQGSQKVVTTTRADPFEAVAANAIWRLREGCATGPENEP